MIFGKGAGAVSSRPHGSEDSQSSEAAGGRKFKSCAQIYEGVGIPLAWREQLIQSA